MRSTDDPTTIAQLVELQEYVWAGFYGWSEYNCVWHAEDQAIMDKYDVGMESEDYSDEETAAKSVRFASLDLSKYGARCTYYYKLIALLMHMYAAVEKRHGWREDSSDSEAFHRWCRSARCWRTLRYAVQSSEKGRDYG